MILSRPRLFCLLVGLILVMAAAIATHNLRMRNDIQIAPHQALYNMHLSRLRQSNTIAGISGQMFYRLDDSCDGWTVDQRFNMQFVYAEGAPALVTSNYNTWESKDGRRYSFATRRQRNGEVTEDIRGKAERNGAGDGQIYLQAPVEQTVALPQNVLFPIQHTMALLKAAKAGEKWFREPLFDGSDLSPATDVNAFITSARQPFVEIEDIKPVVAPDAGMTANLDDKAAIPDTVPHAATAAELNNSVLLKGTHAWRIQMAFFARTPIAADADQADEDDNTPELAPDYEMTMVLHDNGVISSFVIDYPEFSLESHLLGLKEVAKNGC